MIIFQIAGLYAFSGKNYPWRNFRQRCCHTISAKKTFYKIQNMFLKSSRFTRKKFTSSRIHLPGLENQTLVDSRCRLNSSQSAQNRPSLADIGPTPADPDSVALGEDSDPFARLSELFSLLFSYQPLLCQDFARLRAHEKSLFIFILSSKTYHSCSEMADLIRGRSRDVSTCLRFRRKRRKEENLKFGFRMAIQIMREAFNKQNPDLVKRFGSDNIELVFYLFHFSSLKSESSFAQIASSLEQTKPFSNSNSRPFWALIRSFIFPEIVSKCAFSSTKSISKKFLLHVTRSGSFIDQIMHLFVDVTFFLCFCLSHDWSQHSRGAFECRMVRVGLQVLRALTRQNQKDLRRTFSEWSSKVDSMSNLNQIKKSVRRKNFSLPWTFIEVHCSFLDAMLSLVEVFNTDLLESSEEGAAAAIIN